MLLAGRWPSVHQESWLMDSQLCCNPKLLSPWPEAVFPQLFSIQSVQLIHWIGEISLAVIWEYLTGLLLKQENLPEKVLQGEGQKLPSQEMFPETLAALKEKTVWYCWLTVTIAVRCLKLLYNHAKWLNHTWSSPQTMAENTASDTIIFFIFWVANLMCGPASPALEGATPGARSGKTGKGNMHFCRICSFSLCQPNWIKTEGKKGNHCTNLDE